MFSAEGGQQSRWPAALSVQKFGQRRFPSTFRCGVATPPVCDPDCNGLHGVGGSITGNHEVPEQQVTNLAEDPVCEGLHGVGGSIADAREVPEQQVTRQAGAVTCNCRGPRGQHGCGERDQVSWRTLVFAVPGF